MLVPVAIARQLRFVAPEYACHTARPLRCRLALHPAPMTESRELLCFAQLTFQPVRFGHIAGTAENAGDIGIGQQVSGPGLDTPPGAVCMRQTDNLEHFGVRNEDAFCELLRKALAVVRMHQLENGMADQRLFRSADHLAYGRALVGYDSVAVEDGQDVAGVFDKGPIEALDRTRLIFHGARRRAACGCLFRFRGTLHPCSPNPAECRQCHGQPDCPRPVDARRICLTFS